MCGPYTFKCNRQDRQVFEEQVLLAVFMLNKASDTKRSIIIVTYLNDIRPVIVRLKTS
jgi:hypothetical protein